VESEAGVALNEVSRREFLRLAIVSCGIEGWELQENPAQKFTPPLPELNASKVSQTLERLTLVPYGSTELRVTIFPAVKT